MNVTAEEEQLVKCITTESIWDGFPSSSPVKTLHSSEFVKSRSSDCAIPMPALIEYYNLARKAGSTDVLAILDKTFVSGVEQAEWNTAVLQAAHQHPVIDPNEPVTEDASSATINNDTLLPSLGPHIGDQDLPIKIEDDINADSNLYENMERLTYDLDYFDSPASLQLRKTLQSSKRICQKAFKSQHFLQRCAWETVAEVLNVTLRRSVICPQDLGLQSREEMHERVEQARLLCEKYISPADQRTRAAWKVVEDFVKIARRSDDVRSSIEETTEDQAVDQDLENHERAGSPNARGAISSGQVYHIRSNGTSPSDPGSDDDEDDDDDDATPGPHGARRARESAQTFMPGTSAAPSTARDSSTTIPESEILPYRPLGRNPTPIVRRLPNQSAPMRRAHTIRETKLRPAQELKRRSMLLSRDQDQWKKLKKGSTDPLIRGHSDVAP